MNDRRRSASDFLDNTEIELDPRERRIEPSFVNLARLGHALHRRNEIVARPEGEVVVQIVVAVNVYLRGELAIAGRLDEEVDMHRAHSMRPMACISPSEVLPGGQPYPLGVIDRKR